MQYARVQDSPTCERSDAVNTGPCHGAALWNGSHMQQRPSMFVICVSGDTRAARDPSMSIEA